MGGLFRAIGVKLHSSARAERTQTPAGVAAYMTEKCGKEGRVDVDRANQYATRLMSTVLPKSGNIGTLAAGFKSFAESHNLSVRPQHLWNGGKDVFMPRTATPSDSPPESRTPSPDLVSDSRLHEEHLRGSVRVEPAPLEKLPGKSAMKSPMRSSERKPASVATPTRGVRFAPSAERREYDAGIKRQVPMHPQGRNAMATRDRKPLFLEGTGTGALDRESRSVPHPKKTRFSE